MLHYGSRKIKAFGRGSYMGKPTFVWGGCVVCAGNLWKLCPPNASRTSFRVSAFLLGRKDTFGSRCFFLGVLRLL